MENKNYGCSHYKRKCEIEAPCCKIYYSCRLCHDEEYKGPKSPGCKIETLDRYNITKIRCLLCKTEQPPSQKCISCETLFASYYCDICHLYDDSGKDIYHCDECKICRKGKKEDYIHCKTCNACFHKTFEHQCKENVLNQNCGICLENLFYSRNSATQLKRLLDVGIEYIENAQMIYQNLEDQIVQFARLVLKKKTNHILDILIKLLKKLKIKFQLNCKKMQQFFVIIAQKNLMMFLFILME